jgi:hypothetical protein
VSITVPLELSKEGLKGAKAAATTPTTAAAVEATFSLRFSAGDPHTDVSQNVLSDAAVELSTTPSTSTSTSTSKAAAAEETAALAAAARVLDAAESEVDEELLALPKTPRAPGAASDARKVILCVCFYSLRGRNTKSAKRRAIDITATSLQREVNAIWMRDCCAIIAKSLLELLCNRRNIAEPSFHYRREIASHSLRNRSQSQSLRYLCTFASFRFAITALSLRYR